MTKKTRDFQFQVKSTRKSGFISGYASVWGIVDSYNERVMPGAFDETLSDAKVRGRKIPVLWQHRDLIGSWDVIEPDATGLYVETTLPVDKVRQAGEAHALAADGGLTGISIGFDYLDSILHEDSGIRDLTKVWLWEASLVTFPANDSSRILEVRHKIQGGEMPTIKEFEKALRDELGFSRSKAAAIASYGYRHVLRDAGDDENVTAAASLLQKMRAFQISK